MGAPLCRQSAAPAGFGAVSGSAAVSQLARGRLVRAGFGPAEFFFPIYYRGCPGPQKMSARVNLFYGLPYGGMFSSAILG